MTLHEELKALIAKDHPKMIFVNRKMYRKLLKELSKIQGSFEGVLIKIDGVGIYANPTLADGAVQAYATPPIKPL